MKKNILITQSNYIPWKGYFDSIALSDTFVVYDDMQYTKRDWRNRNQIKTANGSKWISIPVEVKGKFEQKINETIVANTTWNIDHWNLLKQNYKNSKNFSEAKDFLEPLYLREHSKFLTDINVFFLQEICKYLNIDCKMKLSSEFILAEERTKRLVNICKELSATKYLTGPAAKNYMDESMFNRENIEIEYLDYSGYKEYEQLFPPFDHAVSIVDLIFNEGENASKFLKYI
ncbi:WbqC family protein [Riemerella anatipestifer]|nr:WbqC family protein [Riemerella anatipestifer]MDY3325303.1 WbqC family protein [Riemerella anatipestifer]MDY3352707.1 WbqC family protein [Riemerella anatipestifer]